ncbi:MAG TPA: ATP-binding protein [Abditibacterium sp.]|jgi:anti-sigma regulatory factor (Ser/Thr protein kinase)
MRITSTHALYSCAAHDELLAQWERVKDDEGPLEIDLRRATFFDPYGIVALVLFLNTLPETALPVRMQLDEFPLQNGAKTPERGPVSYLTRMGFWEEVGERLDLCGGKLPFRPQWSEDKNVLIDVTVLHSRDAVHVMLRKTGEILQSLGFSPIGRGHVMEVLSELSSNVLDHAQSELGGIVSTQTYRSRKTDTRYLVMSIGDAGIGVRQSLSNNGKLADRLESDAQALGVAVQMGASRFASGGRGGGLPRVLEIARRYDGRVAFRSGTGALAYRGEDDQKRLFDTVAKTGTQLRIMLPENRLVEEKKA